MRHILSNRFLSKRSTGVQLSGIRIIFDMAAKIPDIVRLEAGEPDFNTPKHICEAAEKAMREGKTHYTSSWGIPDLRKALAEKARRDNGIDVDPESEIVVTAGSSCALNIGLLSTINPGDEVLIPDPSWPHYEVCVKLSEGVPIPYKLHEERGFNADIHDLASQITNRTKMIVLATPSNPTGGVMNRHDIEAVAQLAIEHDLMVLSDEVYEKMVYDGFEHFSVASIPEMKDRTITVNSFSKTYAMTGWRLGYAMANHQIATEMAKLNLFSNSCPSSIAQTAAVAALTGPQDELRKMMLGYTKRRTIIVNGLNGIKGFSCQKPGGAFYAFPNISQTKVSSWDLAMFLLKEAKVALVPGSAFGIYGEGFIRLSYANSVENIQKALYRIEENIHRLTPKTS
jgi:aspartate/methionine/tyrosine aminotransferase